MTRAALPRALAFLLAGTLASATLPAQQSTPDAQAPAAQAPAAAHAPNPHRQAMRLAKQLNLTPDQTAKLEPILADRDQKLAAIKANTALSPMIAQAQVREVQKNTRQQLSTVLTPEQAQQWKSMQQSREGRTPAQPMAPAA